MIRVVYASEPLFPATDQHPDALRAQIAGYWVDYIGDEPSEAEVLAQAAPTETQLSAEQKQQAKELFDVLSAPLGRLLRALIEALVPQLNNLREQIVGVVTVVFDPPNLADGAGVTVANITVPGAAFGDSVDVNAPYTLQGLMVCGYVHAANTIGVRVQNETGGAVNLGSGTWKIVVRRHVEMPQIDGGDVRTVLFGKVDAEGA